VCPSSASPTSTCTNVECTGRSVVAKVCPSSVSQHLDYARIRPKKQGSVPGEYLRKQQKKIILSQYVMLRNKREPQVLTRTYVDIESLLTTNKTCRPITMPSLRFGTNKRVGPYVHVGGRLFTLILRF